MKYQTIRLNAGNDINGNPRRLYTVLKEGFIVAVYNEDYSGHYAITNKVHRRAYAGLTIDIRPTEYKWLLKKHSS